MADKNFESYSEQTGLTIQGREIIPTDSSYNDTLKFSRCNEVLVEKCLITGGMEDCIDCYRGENYTIQSCRLTPKGKNGITIKGPVSNWVINDVSFAAHGKECDIELGQFGIWARFPFKKDRTKAGSISNTGAVDYDPVVIRVWNAEEPHIFGVNHVKIVKVPWIVWFPYFCFRRVVTMLGGS